MIIDIRINGSGCYPGGYLGLQSRWDLLCRFGEFDSHAFPQKVDEDQVEYLPAS